eukprot:292322-Chlamydomonas_euryale.AAC.6
MVDLHALARFVLISFTHINDPKDDQQRPKKMRYDVQKSYGAHEDGDAHNQGDVLDSKACNSCICQTLNTATTTWCMHVSIKSACNILQGHAGWRPVLPLSNFMHACLSACQPTTSFHHTEAYGSRVCTLSP